MKPKVCIVIANYNYSKWLGQSIKSALAQTYENFTVTVVDDCSTDNSIDIALKTLGMDKEKNLFSENPERIVWTDETHNVVKLKKNSGPSKARNEAIELNIDDCEYFTVLDSDDFIAPNKIEVLVNEITKFQLVECIYGDYFHVYPDGTQKYEFKRTYSHIKLTNECIIHSGSLFSKKALLAVKDNNGFYDERIKGPEDYDLWLRMAEQFFFLHYAAPLTFVRQTGQNISNLSVDGNSENYKKGFELINQKIQERLNVRTSVSR